MNGFGLLLRQRISRRDGDRCGLRRLRTRKPRTQAGSNVDTHGGDAGYGLDCTGQFAFLRPPVGGIVHFGGDRETIDVVQQFIALHRLSWQAFPGKGKTDLVALALRNKNGAAPKLVRGLAALEFFDDLASILRLETGIQKRHWLLGHTLHHEAHGHHDAQHRARQHELARQRQSPKCIKEFHKQTAPVGSESSLMIKISRQFVKVIFTQDSSTQFSTA